MQPKHDYQHGYCPQCQAVLDELLAAPAKYGGANNEKGEPAMPTTLRENLNHVVSSNSPADTPMPAHIVSVGCSGIAGEPVAFYNHLRQHFGYYMPELDDLLACTEPFDGNASGSYFNIYFTDTDGNILAKPTNDGWWVQYHVYFRGSIRDEVRVTFNPNYNGGKVMDVTFTRPTFAVEEDGYESWRPRLQGFGALDRLWFYYDPETYPEGTLAMTVSEYIESLKGASDATASN